VSVSDVFKLENRHSLSHFKPRKASPLSISFRCLPNFEISKPVTDTVKTSLLQFDFFFDIVAFLINFNMRYIPLVAWFFSLAAFILALLTFLAGIDGDAMENAAILTVNISSGIFRMIQQR
jgi:hypothetical protein